MSKNVKARRARRTQSFQRLTPEEWDYRVSRFEFRLPTIRLFDLLLLSVLGVSLILLLGGPDGVVARFIKDLWNSSDDSRSLSGPDLSATLIGAALTAFSLLLSIGGARYIEAAKEQRAEFRARARELRAYAVANNMSDADAIEETISSIPLWVRSDAPKAHPVAGGSKRSFSTTDRTVDPELARMMRYAQRRAGKATLEGKPLLTDDLVYKIQKKIRRRIGSSVAGTALAGVVVVCLWQRNWLSPFLTGSDSRSLPLLFVSLLGVVLPAGALVGRLTVRGLRRDND